MIHRRVVRLSVAVHRLLVLLEGHPTLEGLQADGALVVSGFRGEVVLMLMMLVR